MRWGMMWAVTVAAMVLAGCGELGNDNEAKLLAEKQIEASLKDPDSAKFSGEFVIRSEPDSDGHQDIVTCGYVNAKNSFGGYAGDSRFIVTQSLNKKLQTFGNIHSIMEDENPMYRDPHPEPVPGQPATVFEQLYWNKSCVDPSHPPSFTAG